MEIRSLGYRTDLMVRVMEGSQVIDRGDHLVIRSPANPDFWWGNFLLLGDLEPGSGRQWLARFAAEFPDAGHVAIGMDVTDAGAVDQAELTGLGLETDRAAVLTAVSLREPPRPNTDAVVRPLAGDDDWLRAAELRVTVSAHGPGDDIGFLRARTAAERAAVEAGHGTWYGAFLDDMLAAQLGIFSCKTSGVARYQTVETRPSARRRGLAGTLAWHAGHAVLSSGQAETLVIVADPDDIAIGVYRSLGFRVTEDQLGFQRPPDER